MENRNSSQLVARPRQDDARRTTQPPRSASALRTHLSKSLKHGKNMLTRMSFVFSAGTSTRKCVSATPYRSWRPTHQDSLVQSLQRASAVTGIETAARPRHKPSKSVILMSAASSSVPGMRRSGSMRLRSSWATLCDSDPRNIMTPLVAPLGVPAPAAIVQAVSRLGACRAAAGQNTLGVSA